MKAASIGILFIGLATVFLGAAVRDALRREAQPIARRAWLRVALIFTTVGIGLQFLDLLH